MKENEKLVYDYIKCFIEHNNYSPSVREIMTGINTRSPSYVHALLIRLKDKGFIDYKENACRTIRIVK